MSAPFCPRKDDDFLGYGKICHWRCDEYIQLSTFSAVQVCATGTTLRHHCPQSTTVLPGNAHTVFVCQAAGKLFAMAACVVLEVGGTGGASQHSGAKQPGAL